MITIDDFKKLEIRVGEILSAEKVPETDKLLKLSVAMVKRHLGKLFPVSRHIFRIRRC